MADAPVITHRLVTRGYELGPDGVLPPSALLRYLEHVRWQTLTTDGPIPVRRFWGLGVVRAQLIEILEPISFHVELELSLWVSRVGRTSFDFSHDVVRVSDGKRVAASTATVVALGQDRRPQEIAPEAREYVLDRPVASVSRPGSGAAPDAWSMPIVLRPSDHDMQQHVNHARYVDFIEDARVTCTKADGYGTGPWHRRVRSLYIQYEKEARLGDSVSVRTWPVADETLTVDFEIVRDGADVLTRARVGLDG